MVIHYAIKNKKFNKITIIWTHPSFSKCLTQSLKPKWFVYFFKFWQTLQNLNGVANPHTSGTIEALADSRKSITKLTENCSCPLKQKPLGTLSLILVFFLYYISSCLFEPKRKRICIDNVGDTYYELYNFNTSKEKTFSR